MSTTEEENKTTDDGPTERIPRPEKGGFGKPTVSTGATVLAKVAAEQVSLFIAADGKNNKETRIVPIALGVSKLRQTFENTLKPIVYGNYRALGVRTFTDPNDVVILDSIIYTVSVDATLTAGVILYKKAMKINGRFAQTFGRVDTAVPTSFPALLTLLIESLGPYETSTLPYEAIFVPTISNKSIRNLMNDNRYKAALAVNFSQAMARSRTVTVSTVDIQSTASSAWWMLHRRNPITNVDGTEENEISVFSPVEFEHRDHATILGGMVLEETLYELPGPLITAQVGPFPRTHVPRTIDDIPNVIAGPRAINKHVPAIDVVFSVKTDDMTRLDAIAYGLTFEDEALIRVAGVNDTLDDAAEDDDADDTASKKSRKRTKTRKRTIDIDAIMHALIPGSYKLYMATVLYFDYQLYDRVHTNTREQVVSKANGSI